MDGSEEKAAARWRQCGRLVQAVRAGTQEKKFYDESVKALRAQLKAEFEALLLEDYRYAQSKDAEQMLWKTVFYTVIEEFRRRIKAATAQGQKGSEPLRKTTAVFVKFLHEASVFYALLTAKLQAAYGQLGFALAFPGMDDDLAAAAQRSALPNFKAALDCRISIYRCLICLGDLARYEEMAVKDANSKKDWGRAEQYYYQAVDVFPEGGNSFNQLAVLATYNEAHLQAVCHYFRSLAVAHPFQVARENLLLLFDQARAKYERLPAGQVGTPAAPGKGRGRGKAAQKPRAPLAQLLPVLSVRFAHAHGVLFCKINLDSFNDILEGAFADLDDLLARTPVARGGNGEARRSDAILMQLTVMCLFAAWNADYSPPGRPAGYSEALQIAEVKRHVRTLTFGLAARLAFAAACVGDISMLHAGALLTSPLLPPLNVLLQWMSTQQEMFRSDDVDAAEARERAAFWGALCKLLLLMPGPADALPSAALPEDWQLRAFGPLNAAHQHLDFQLSRTEEDDAALRLQRMLRALRTIADALPEPGAEVTPRILSPQREEERAAAMGFRRAALRMFTADNQAMQGVAPARGDVLMHEGAAGVEDPDLILSANKEGHAGGTSSCNGAPVQEQKQAAVDPDDDMEEDEERILYNPAQPVALMPAQEQGLTPAAQQALGEEGSKNVREQQMEGPAEKGKEEQTDILDQLMLDGAVQDPQPGGMDALLAYQPAGQARGEGTFSPVKKYGTPMPRPAAAAAALAAAEPAYGAQEPSTAVPRLPRDLSDADLGLLEIPGDHPAPKQGQQGTSDLMRILQDVTRQQEQAASAQPNAPSGVAQLGLEAHRDLLPGGCSAPQGLQQSMIAQQQQKQYAGPGTVAPHPSALPHPGSLGAAQWQGAHSAAPGAQLQAATNPAAASASYNDLLAARERADASLAGLTTVGSSAQGAGLLPTGQPVGPAAQQLPKLWPGADLARRIAAPDNSAGLTSWQAITDLGKQNSGAGMAVNPEAAAGGPSGVPGQGDKSFMREGASTAGAGGFLGRDLFANQRSELSRGASPANMWEAAGPNRANAITPPAQNPGILPGTAHAGYGTGPAPAAYGGAPGGFYINRQPALPAAPGLGGFYQRDSRELEAHLLAQALAARTGQPASSQGADQHTSNVGVGGAVGDPGQLGSRMQSPAVPSAAQHSGMHPGQAQGQLPLSGLPGQPGSGLLGTDLPQLPQPSLWPAQPNQNMMLGQLGQQQGLKSLFPASLGFGLPGNAGMPGVGAAGQGFQGYSGNWAQYGATNGGGGLQNAYGLQNGAVHLGSGQPTAQQGFAGLSNAQLQQRLALLQESSGVSLAGQGLQVNNAAGMFGQSAQPDPIVPAKPDSGTFSWLDAFQARQDALRAQAAGGAAPSAFPFPGASADSTMRLGNPNDTWRAH